MGYRIVSLFFALFVLSVNSAHAISTGIPSYGVGETNTLAPTTLLPLPSGVTTFGILCGDGTAITAGQTSPCRYGFANYKAGIVAGNTALKAHCFAGSVTNDTANMKWQFVYSDATSSSNTAVGSLTNPNYETTVSAQYPRVSGTTLIPFPVTAEVTVAANKFLSIQSEAGRIYVAMQCYEQ